MRGLAEMVPGGGAVFDIAKRTFDKYRLRRNLDQMRKDVQQIAQAGVAEVKQAASEAAKQVPGKAMRIQVELFLEQIPAAVQQSLKRADDPTGKSLPANFSLHGAEDVAKLLPTTLPRFKPGDALPGRSGWVLDRHISGGGFGEVWLARNVSVGFVRAIKFCKSMQNPNRDLHHEVRVIKRLISQGKHPNIVPLLDAHLDGEAPWLMYEYVDGGDLGDMIRYWATLPLPQRREKVVTALQILAKAVGRFHQMNPPIVHRDLKPANILYDKYDKSASKLRITDFGIGAIAAREMIDGETRGTLTSAGRLQSHLYGSYTPLYASSQQKAGDFPDPRDDVHALGVIAYQMLTSQITQGVGPDYAHDLRDVGVEDALIELVGRCTAQKAERRPRDAGEIAEILTKIAYKGNASPSPLAKADPYVDIREDERIYLRASNSREYFELHGPQRIARWKEAGQKGLSAAQNLYGECLCWGIGIRQNLTEAIAWYRKAAEQGYVAAQFNLANMYANGQGVAKDELQAVAWYRKAAEQGHATAQFNLANMYAKYRKAAEQAHAAAQSTWEDIDGDGQGVSNVDLRPVTWSEIGTTKTGNVRRMIDYSLNGSTVHFHIYNPGSKKQKQRIGLNRDLLRAAFIQLREGGYAEVRGHAPSRGQREKIFKVQSNWNNTGNVSVCIHGQGSNGWRILLPPNRWQNIERNLT